MFMTILVAIDGSPPSLRGLEHAEILLGSLNRYVDLHSRVVILSVHETD
jgi:nucleotide-binding universal stress UspA family protein